MNRMKAIKRWSPAFFTVIISMLLTACGNSVKVNEKAVMQEQENIKEYRSTDFAMGTVVSEVIYSSGNDLTSPVIERLRSVEEKWISWRVEDSEIANINQSAGGEDSVAVSEEIRSFLETSLTLARLSEGAFDPTIGEISSLWDIDGESPSVPADEEIQKLLQNVGYQKIKVDQNTVFLEPGSSLDLGAAGKGIGCDQIVELLKSDASVSGAVISVGGSSILTYGNKPDDSPWKVAITDPRSESGEFLGTIGIDGTHFFSTSGDYEKYFIQDEIRYHHILDPSTGYPARSDLISVTIMCDNGLISDGLSTACFVLGREKSIELLKKYNAEAIFVDEEKNVYLTEGIRDNFELTQEGYQIILEN